MKKNNENKKMKNSINKVDRIRTIMQYIEVKNGDVNKDALKKMIFKEFGHIHGVDYDTIDMEVDSCFDEYINRSFNKVR